MALRYLTQKCMKTSFNTHFKIIAQSEATMDLPDHKEKSGILGTFQNGGRKWRYHVVVVRLKY